MHDLRAYLGERLALWRFGPLALVIGLLGAPLAPESAARVGLALLIIATFRLRDDLADGARDSVAHSERVLVRARSIRPFAIAVVIGLLLGFVGLSLVHGLARGLGLLGLAAAFELGYRLELGGRHRWVLLKYPIFAILLGDSLAPTLVGLCYLGIAIHERIDDESLRARPDANLRLAGYSCAAALVVGMHLLLLVTPPYGSFAQALWLALPVTLAGLTHVLAIERGVLPGLARIRLDGGLELRGRPLLGANKTLRGAIVMIAAAVFWTGVVDRIQQALGLDDSLRFISRDQLGSIGLGLVLGIAYILGELPNSFIKRQLDIAPGAAAAGGSRKLFWMVDQLDSAIAIVLALSLFRAPSLGLVLTLLGVTLAVHPAVAAIMVAVGLKRRIG